MILAVSCLGVGPVAGEQPAASDSGTAELIVRFEPADVDGVSDASVERLQIHAETTQAPLETFAAGERGVEIERSFWVANAALVTVDTARTDPGRLREIDGVRAVHPNYGVDRHGSTDRGKLASQPDQSQETAFATGVRQINAPAVWEFYDTRGEDVAVAVLDTGVDPNGHEGIRRSLERGGWAEFDESGNRVDSQPHDPNGHGTRVSGIIAGDRTDAGVSYGVAPDVALYHARATGSLAAHIAGIEWAVENDVDVISMSVGPVRYAEAYVEPIENARSAGVEVVAAIGNAHRYTSVSPANLQSVVGVGAVDRTGAVPAWSAGERIDTERYWAGTAPPEWDDQYTVPELTAPGVNVTVAQPGGGYGTNEGTSYAAPHAAGALALAVSATERRPTEVREALLETARHPATDDPFATDPGHDDRHGAGVVDPLATISRLRATETVSGAVTDANGEPIAGATVGSETGPRTTTDEDGEYTLSVPAGEQPFGAVDTGYAFETTLLDPAERDQFDFELEANSVPDVALADGFPTRLGPGEEMTATFEVANVDRARVGVNTPGATTDRLSVQIDGEPVEFGEIVELELDRTDRVTVGVRASEGVRPGRVDLTVGFSGGEQIVQGTVGTVHVHPAPYAVERGELQSAVEIAAPGTRILLRDGRYELPAADGRPGALVVDRPVSIVAERDAQITTPDPAGATVYVGANDVTLAGVEIGGGGADTAVTAGTGVVGRETDTPSGLTIRDSRLVGDAVGFRERSAPAAWLAESRVTADGVGVATVGPQRTSYRGNTIRDVTTGVEIAGVITDFSGNEIRNVEGDGIVIATPREALAQITVESGPIRGNTVDGATDGIAVRGGTDSPIENNQLRNIRNTGINVTGSALGPIRGNTIDGARTGIRIEGEAAGAIEGNEFVNVGRERTVTSEHPASSLGVVLYGATAVSIAVLFVPYVSRQLRRREVI